MSLSLAVAIRVSKCQIWSLVERGWCCSFSGVGFSPLVQMEAAFIPVGKQDIFGQLHAPKFLGTECKCLLWLCTSAQSKAHKDMSELIWGGRPWLTYIWSQSQSNKTQLGWTDIENVSQALTSHHQSFTSDHTKVLLDEWAKRFTNKVLNFVESLSRRPPSFELQRMGQHPIKDNHWQ